MLQNAETCDDVILSQIICFPPFYIFFVTDTQTVKDVFAPRRHLPERKSQKRLQGTKALKNGSQKSPQEADFGLDNTAECPSAQLMQLDRICLRRGRSYLRGRNYTGTECEMSDTETCAVGSMLGTNAQSSPEKAFAFQGSASSQNSRHNGELLKGVTHGELLPAQCSDSDVTSPYTCSRVRNSVDSDDVFIPRDPPQAQVRKGLKAGQKSKRFSPKTPTSEEEDSDFHVEQKTIKILETKTLRHRRVLKKYENCIESAGDVSLVRSELGKQDKKKTMRKSTRRRKVSGDSVSDTNGLTCPDNTHRKHSKEVDEVQSAVSDNSRSASVKGKAGNKNRQSRTHSKSEEDVSEGKWTKKELQKLHE